MTSRRPSHIPPRKAIPRAVIREVMGRSGGRCEYVGGCTETGAELDHIIPQALGGKETAENIALLCAAHHAEKTKIDVKMIARADRMGGRSGQQKRRKTGGSKWPKGRKQDIPSRGFDKRFTRTIASKNKPSKTVKRQATKSNREVTFK